MKHYQDLGGSVWAFEADGSQDDLITDGMTLLSAESLISIRSSAMGAPSPKQFTSLEYLDLFTESEQLAVVSATMAVPQVKLWYDKMLAAGYVTIADPRTEGGLAALVGAGLLTEARKLEILAVMA